MKILLDSVIVIDHLNGIEQATRYLERHADRAAVSVITRAEVLAGAKPRAVAKVRRLLELFPNLAITAEIADRAAALRRKHRWKQFKAGVYDNVIRTLMPLTISEKDLNKGLDILEAVLKAVDE